MKTCIQAVEALSPKKINDSQRMHILKVENAMKDLTTDIYQLVPESPERTRVINHILDAKLLAVQAISHPPVAVKPVVQAPPPPPAENPPQDNPPVNTENKQGENNGGASDSNK